jgi:hypothetical protein
VLSMNEECYEFHDKLSVELRKHSSKLGTHNSKRVNLVGVTCQYSYPRNLNMVGNEII